MSTPAAYRPIVATTAADGTSVHRGDLVCFVTNYKRDMALANYEYATGSVRNLYRRGRLVFATVLDLATDSVSSIDRRLLQTRLTPPPAPSSPTLLEMHLQTFASFVTTDQVTHLELLHHQAHSGVFASERVYEHARLHAPFPHPDQVHAK